LFYIYGKDDLDLKWEIKSKDVKFIIEKCIKKLYFRRSSGGGERILAMAVSTVLKYTLSFHQFSWVCLSSNIWEAGML